MILNLLNLLRQHPAGVDLASLSRELEAPPGLVLAMLDTLARKGRLREVGPDGGTCNACAVAAGCQLLRLQSKRYCLT